jgi:hypothetical protein
MSSGRAKAAATFDAVDFFFIGVMLASLIVVHPLQRADPRYRDHDQAVGEA